MQNPQANILEKAENALASVNAASATARGLFTGFMLLTAYLAITFTSVTHLELLKYSPIKLPIINVGVDMKSFYAFVPWLYMIIHANMLLVFSLITDKINQLEQTIQPLEYQQRQSFRNRIHVLIFAQYLSQRHSGVLKTLISLIVWISVGFFPLLLLLTAQVAFLPAQEEGVLWSQRLCILIDALLVFYFWSSILQKRRMALISKEWKLPQWRRYNKATKLLFVISCLFILFSVFIATAPCGSWDSKLGKCGRTYPGIPEADYSAQKGFNVFVRLTNYFFDGHVSHFQRRRSLHANKSPFQRRIVVEGKTIIQNEQTLYKTLDDVVGINLEKRNLLFASFAKSRLPKAILRDALLNGVDFQYADLHESSLESASLYGSNLAFANLQYTNIRGASFVESDLYYTNFNNATINFFTSFDNSRNMSPDLHNWLNKCKEKEYSDASRRSADTYGKCILGKD